MVRNAEETLKYKAWSEGWQALSGNPQIYSVWGFKTAIRCMISRPMSK